MAAIKRDRYLRGLGLVVLRLGEREIKRLTVQELERKIG